jgi:glycerol-3-phosphate O-acyltransferase / dihydroxyacetone phosphate acyltransferase
LEQGGAVIIFPEGISLTDRILKKLKTGAMRMALGAEVRNDFKLKVHILPMGLNFSNPHKFRSKLQINIGKPICVADYKEQFYQDSFKAAHAMKDDIRMAIEQLTLCIDSLTTDQLIARVESIYKRNFLDAENRDNLETEEEFRIAELIRDRVYFFIKNDISRVEKMSELLDNHAELLKLLNLDGEVIKVVGGEKRKFDFKDFLYYFFGFPIFLFGFVNNVIPYKIPGIIARKIDGRDAFTGSILMTSGAFVFLIFYVFQSLMVFYLSDDIILTSFYLLILPITGLMAYNYHERFQNQLQTIRYHQLVVSGDKKAIELLDLEVAIISQIESAMKYFEAAELNISKKTEASI